MAITIPSANSSSVLLSTTRRNHSRWMGVHIPGQLRGLPGSTTRNRPTSSAPADKQRVLDQNGRGQAAMEVVEDRRVSCPHQTSALTILSALFMSAVVKTERFEWVMNFIASYSFISRCDGGMLVNRPVSECERDILGPRRARKKQNQRVVAHTFELLPLGCGQTDSSVPACSVG